MDDKFFDHFGEFLFGKDDNELNKFFRNEMDNMKQYPDLDPSKKIDLDDENLVNETKRKIEGYLTEDLDNSQLYSKISNILGPPVKIIKFGLDNLNLQEIIWNVGKKGEIGLVMPSDTIIDILHDTDNSIYKTLKEWSDLVNSKYKEKSLQEQLDEAILNEEYEKCAILRDKIKEEK